MRIPILSLLSLAVACGSPVPPDCQMMPSAQGGYVLQLARNGAATAAASSCAQGNGSLPKPHVDPNSTTGRAIRVGLPDRNGQLSSQVTNLTWGTPTNYQPVRQFRFSLRFTF